MRGRRLHWMQGLLCPSQEQKVERRQKRERRRGGRSLGSRSRHRGGMKRMVWVVGTVKAMVRGVRALMAA